VSTMNTASARRQRPPAANAAPRFKLFTGTTHL
jgi:hypothetical protein